MKIRHSATTLLRLKLVENKCSVDSRGSIIIRYKNYTSWQLQSAKRSVGSQTISIVRCQKHICVQPNFESNLPLAPTQLLFEAPSLRIMCELVILRLHQQTDFTIFGSQFEPRDNKFERFCFDFQNFARNPANAFFHYYLASTNTCQKHIFCGLARFQTDPL